MLNRWLKYAQAKVTSVVKSSDDEVARREARLEAEMAEKPWLRSDSESPTFDEVRERIERETPRPSASATPTTSGSAPKPSGEAAFDLAEQQRAADERLAEIRKSLDLGGEPSGDT
jgi:hypothetical protein